VLLNEYYNDDQNKKNEMGVECGTYGRMQMGVQGFVWNPERKRPFGKSTPRRENNIKMDLKEIAAGLFGMKTTALQQ